jgi:hypothetical protein
MVSMCVCCAAFFIRDSSRFDGRRVGSAKSDVWARQVKLYHLILFSIFNVGIFKSAIESQTQFI